MNDYNLTPHSLYVAAPVGLETETIRDFEQIVKDQASQKDQVIM